MLKVNIEGKSTLEWDKVQDSGTRTAFGTGSQRDTQQGKGRYDLIPTSMLHRLAQHYENGAVKYGDNNWQKGQPLAQYYNSAIRHLNAIKDGDLEEDHFSAAIWNIAAMIHHIDKMLANELPMELDSFGIVKHLKAYDAFKQLTEYTEENTQTYAYPEPTYNPLWNPVVSSGEMPNMPVTKTVWDKDRFKEKEHKIYRTAKLDPEELG